MVTGLTRPTTLAQYKTALESAEASQVALTKDLEATRKANTQLTTDLRTAKLEATRTQEQLAAQLKECQAEQAKLRKDMAALEKQLLKAQEATTQAQADAAKAKAEATRAQADLAKARAEATQAQADKAATEAQASRQLTEASELMNRQKLAAVAGADREVKLAAEITALRKQLEQVATTTATATVPDTSAQLAQLRQQIDALVAENRRMAESRDQLTHDQQTLADTIKGHQLAQSQAVEKARTEAQLAAGQEIARLQESLRLGQSRLATMTAQLQATGKLEVLAADQVGALMSNFLQQMEGGMPSLRLAEGELKLKLGLASSGTTQGFVILQPGAQADAQATVHEVALKFDRSGALNLPKP